MIRRGSVQDLIEVEARLGRCGGRVPARGLIERAGEPGVEYGRIADARGEVWWCGRFAEVGEEGVDRGGLGEKGDQAHLAVAARADERTGSVPA